MVSEYCHFLQWGICTSPGRKSKCLKYYWTLSKKSKAGNRYRRRPEGSLFNSYYTEMWGRALLLSLDCYTLPLIPPSYCWVLSKEASSTIFKVFGMTRPGIETRSPGPLANTLPTWPMNAIEECLNWIYWGDIDYFFWLKCLF